MSAQSIFNYDWLYATVLNVYQIVVLMGITWSKEGYVDSIFL